MKRSVLFSFLTGLSLILMFTCGCMVLRGENFQDFSETYPQLAGELGCNDSTVALTINATHFANGQASPNPNTKGYYEEAFLEALKDQKLFRAIGKDVTDPDWSLKVDIREEEHFSEVGAAICGLTLGLVPAVDNIKIQGTATAFDKMGKEVTTFTANQDAKVVIEILLLLPWRTGIVDEVHSNLAKDIILQFAQFVQKYEGAKDVKRI